MCSDELPVKEEGMKPPQQVTCPIPGTSLDLRMVPIPGPDGSPAFYMSDAEISWDHYDVFVYELDQPVNEHVDAITRPTRPYISADRGWGHANYPALSISHKGAQAFCEWLSAGTGNRWRLPTVVEWQQACQLGQITTATVDEHAWHSGNSKRRTHKLRTKRPDALGLHDLHGNVSEWCQSADDTYVLVGACYSDAGDSIQCDMIKTPVPEWNDTDPQIPRSTWWLADAPFAGFRVVCESPQPVNQDLSTPGDVHPGGETP
ncbi:MAG: formylglycine-generating enzyme family protein [Planctomycetota bacterium]|nr:formylglycine-generating enzyme family protein [Planctomycetota bacterium]